MEWLDLSVKIDVDDQATPEIESIGKSIKNGIGMSIGGRIVGAVEAGADALVGFAQESVSVGMEFDTAMSQVAATGGKTMDELLDTVVSTSTSYGDFNGNLRDFARYMGKQTSFSAREAAEGLNYMALAGYDAQTSVDMLPSVLTLAAAGALELGDASDMLTDVQSALGLSLEETYTLVDQMAAASANSNTSVGQLGAALLTVGGTAKQMSGGTLEAATALGILANNGIKGSEGGTALRNILLSTIPKSDAAAEAFDLLGLSFYNAEGEMRPLNESFGDLALALDGYTAQGQVELLSAMFNKVDLKSVSALLANCAEGVDAVNLAVSAVVAQQDDELGYYQRVAEALNNNGHEWYDLGEVIYNTLDENGNVTEETRQALLDLGVSSEDVEVIMAGLAGTVLNGASGWQQLEGNIAGAWYTTQSLANELANNGLPSMEQMQTNMDGLGITADEFSTALQYCNGDAGAFAEALLASANEGTTLDDVIATMGGNLEGVQTAFDNTTAAAQLMADTQLDNLSGDITIMQSALSDLQIEISDIVAPALRDMAQIGTDALMGITALIAGDESSAQQAFSSLSEKVGSVWASITTGISEALPEIETFLTELPGNAGIWIGDVTRTLVEKGGELIGGMLSGLAGDGGESPIAQFFADLPGNVVTFIGDVTQTLYQAGRDFISGLLTGSTETTDADLATEIGNLPDKVFGFLGDTTLTLWDKGVEIVTGFYAGFSDILNGDIKTELGGFLAKVGEFIGSAATSLVNTGIDFITGFLTGSRDETEGNGKSFFESVFNVLKGWMTTGIDVLTFLGSLGNDLIGGFMDGITGGKWDDIKGWIEDVPNKIVEFVGDLTNTLLDTGKNVIGGLLDGIKYMFDGTNPNSVQKWFTNLPGKISSWLEETDPIGWLVSVGENVINGFIEGVNNFDLRQMIIDTFGPLGEAACDILGIQSPSTVFASIGDFVMQGFENGIDGGEEAVDSTLAGIANGLPENFADAYWTMHDMGAGLAESFRVGMNNQFWDSVIPMVQAMPDMIATYFGDGTYTLWYAAQNMMVGFGNSLISTFNSYVAPTLSSITRAIPSYKGPLETDKHLLEDNGEAIMYGLLNGIREGSRDVYDELSNITSNIRGTNTDVPGGAPTVIMADAFRGANISFRNREDMYEFSEMLADHIARQNMGRYQIA